jgi:hypothetical protein
MVPQGEINNTGPLEKELGGNKKPRLPEKTGFLQVF